MRSDIKDLYLTITRVIASSDLNDDLILALNEGIQQAIKAAYTDAKDGGSFDDTIQVEKSRTK